MHAARACLELITISIQPAVPIPFRDAPDRVTILAAHDSIVTAKWLQWCLDSSRRDDVFRDAFLTGVLFVFPGNSSHVITGEARKLLKSLGAVWLGTCDCSYGFKQGPHAKRNRKFAPVYRLYDDTHGAFLHSMGPGPEG